MPESEMFVPDYLNAPWLNEEYVEKNAWYPVPDEWLGQKREKEGRFEHIGDKKYPMKSRSEFRPGDIIIFFEYDERTDKEGKRQTDRFCTVEKEEIEQYKRGERDLLPVGVVVHPPAKK